MALLEPLLRPISKRRRLGLWWAGLAVVMALGGGRRGRRAAIRAGMSAAGASLIANVLLKPVVRRARPQANLRTRLLHSRPSTRWSFPSSHAATAFGFGVGAAIEVPVSAVVLLPTAAVVGYSRVYGRAHHAGDVVAGAVLGTAAAAVSTRLWPVAPSDGASLRPVRTSVERLPSPDGQGLTIAVNPRSGPALSANPATRLREALPNAEVVELAGDDDLDEVLRAAAKGGARAIGAAGGDGTLNAGAAVADDLGLPFLAVPAGTLNHFAKDLGLGSVEEAVEAVQRGDLVAVDVALADGRPFLNTLSLGSYVDLVDAREKLEKVIGKWPAVVVALTRVIRRAEPLEIDIDGRRRSVWMLFVGNCRYHPSGFAPTWRERLDDGLLDVRVVDATHPGSRTRLVLAVLTGRLSNCRAYESWVADRLVIDCPSGGLRLAVDGETIDASSHVVVEKRPEKLRVFAPPTD